MPWYCVRSQPKRERLAAESLRAQLGLEVYCPQVRFRRQTVRGAVWFQEALFPGYLFARFQLKTLQRAVGSTVGVLNIPQFGGHIFPIPDTVIDGIRAELEEVSERDVCAAFRVGQETTVISGSMQGLSVKVIKLMPAQERIRVLLELMGTLVEVEVPVSALEHPMQHPLLRQSEFASICE